ncbi:hypothetical protein FRB99_006844 [Tulasnella sp. 403]|nr:hypothetical protein FRB99_006844 [Tulasnella sp. 403]
MKLASEAVIRNAIDLILEDIAVQNPGFGGIFSNERLPLDASLGKLDLQVDLLFQTISTVVAQFRSRIAQGIKQRNRLSLIHRLPIEVLIEIFGHTAWRHNADHCYYRQLARLSRVCTFWAAIIRQTPTLWTTIHEHNALHLVETIIARSRNCPLLVYASGRGCRCLPALPIKSLLRLLHPQIHRLKVAEFVVDPRDDMYLQKYLTNVSAPQLKKLHVSFLQLYGVEGTHCIDLFYKGADHLDELELAGVAVSWTSALLFHLRILRLQNLNCGAALTIGGVLDIAGQCPNLTTLWIRNCYVYDASDPPDHLELTHLRDLDIGDITPHTSAYSILSRISSPKLDLFSFVSRPPFGVQESLTTKNLENLLHLVPSFVHLVTSATSIALCINGDGCRLNTPLGDRPLNLTIYDGKAFPRAVLDWVTAYLGDAMRDVETRIDIFKLSLSERDLAALGRIPLLTALHLIGDSNQTLSLIRFLSTTTFVSGWECWSLPHLAELEITIIGHSHGSHHILHMVQSRYGHTLESEEARSTAWLPSPFTTLAVHEKECSMDPRMYRRISDIVGKHGLHWFVGDDDYLDSLY